MYRSDLSFLEAMFPEDDYTKYHILVVNQTDKERQLSSTHPNIRVINTEERGLPQSRNMALENAMGDICLIADDDVWYVSDVAKIVIDAFKQRPLATVVSFQMEDEDGKLYRDYPVIETHTKKTVYTVNGVVIAFNREMLLASNARYDNHFGLGTTFQTANEFVFMRNVLKEGLLAQYEPKVILRHPVFNSGMASGSDRVIYARAALNYKYYGVLSYLWVLKYVRFLVAHKFIKMNEAMTKIKLGFSGIKKYKQLH